MSGSVTVPGTNGSIFSIPQPTPTSFNVAQQIADAIVAASTAGGFSVVSAAVEGSIPLAPLGGPSELFLTGGTGSVNVPFGYNFVVDNASGPVTISATEASILSGTVGGTFFVSGTGSIAAGGGDNVVGAIGPGTFNIGTGAGNDTLDGLGTKGTLAGGDGSNLFFAGTVGGSVNVLSIGKNDTVAALGGAVTINASGSNELTFGTYGIGSGSLAESVTGSGATISSAASNASITLAGSNALVFGGFNSQLSGVTAGTLAVLDLGSKDTISAGDSPATVTAGAGSSGLWVFGGTQRLNFVGGAGTSTVVAGSGGASVTGDGGSMYFGNSGASSTVVGGTGLVTMYGGTSGSNVVFTSGTTGGAFYVAGTGNETLSASGSSANNVVFGGSDTTANDVIVTGSGNDTLVGGKGNETLTGGTGSDQYFFVHSLTGGSNITITDFNSSDNVALFGYGQTTAQALATATVSGAGTTITLSDNTKITFTGVTSLALIGNVTSS